MENGKYKRGNSKIYFKDLYLSLHGKDEYNIDYSELDCLFNPKKTERTEFNYDNDLLIKSKDVQAVLNSIKNSSGNVYALIAPAFRGQFNSEAMPGKLRSAFKHIGFDGMVEVALFADILTLKEALEFDKNIKCEKDFQLTSCCCPMWIAMIRKIYQNISSHLTASVSPMIACGRVIKKLHPDAVTVFIGPCIAKKAEAKDKELLGAIDHVLTFQEINSILNAAGVDISEMEENEKDHSSKSGRIYARAGGVSEAVQLTLERINPHRKIKVKTQKASGIPDCKSMINDLLSGNIEGNFFEGMGCVGGCVGGPKSIINREKGKENVNIYGEEATYLTPIDNPYVIELLHRLGLDTVDDLLYNSEIFTREL